MKNNEFSKWVVFILLIIVVGFVAPVLAVNFEIWRYHAVEHLIGHHISFFTYLFLFGGHR